MDRTFESGAAGSPPSAPASPSSGYPTAGNPSLGVPATKPGPWWYHMMTEELRAVIVAAGLTPGHTNLNQLLDALTLLGLRDASETLKGRIEIATAAEVAALTDAGRAITPAGLASVFAKSLATNGYQKLPGGLIIQWGTPITTGTTSTFSLPIAFPNGGFSITAVDQGAGRNSYGVAFSSLSQITVYSSASGQGFRYIAAGY